MPGTEVTGKAAGEAFLMGLVNQEGQLIGEAILLAVVSPLQALIIGEALLLCKIDQTAPPTTARRQPVSGDLQWLDQP